MWMEEDSGEAHPVLLLGGHLSRTYRPWVDENCGQNAEKNAVIWIFIVSNMCCHLLDAGCNIDNSSSVFSGAR